MQIQTLDLNNFRNLVKQKIDFSSCTLLVGANGQGKTSVLEAIYILTIARSFRTSKLKEAISWSLVDQKPALNISGSFETKEGIKEIEFSLTGSKKNITLNGNKITKASSFYGQVNSLVFTPKDIKLIQGGPSERREYIDLVLALTDNNYVDTLVNYKRALKQRNALLKDKKKSSREELIPWELTLIKNGLEIIQKRREAFLYLVDRISFFTSELSKNSAGEKNHINYSSDFLLNGQPLSEDEIMSIYDNNLEKDLSRGSTSVGPHRDDIEFLIDTGFSPKPAKNSSSQGQARTFSLACKIAALEYVDSRLGEPPILLLDDVESELDTFRKSSLYSIVSSFNAQVVISATEVEKSLYSKSSEYQILHVKSGQISTSKN